MIENLAEGTMNDMGRPNPPIKPLNERLESKLTCAGYTMNDYTK